MAKNTKPERHAMLDEMVAACSKQSSLESWNSFIEAVDMPIEIAPALLTGRTELLAMMQPRALTAEECAKMFDVIKTLIRTNAALRQHAEQTAHLVDIWSHSFQQLHSIGRDIEQFANFRKVSPDEHDEAA